MVWLNSLRKGNFFFHPGIRFLKNQVNPFLGPSNFKLGPKREIKRKKTCTYLRPRAKKPNIQNHGRPSIARLRVYCGGDQRNVIAVNDEVDDTVNCRSVT